MHHRRHRTEGSNASVPAVRAAVVAASLFALASVARGAAPAPPPVDKVEPDRRDFTTGTGIVPSGRIQVEGGVTGERGDAERSVSIGDITIRVPLSESFEVHLGLPSFLVRDGDRRRSGFDDAALEARYRLLHGDAIDLGVQVMSTLPTGNRRVAERRLQPGAVLAARMDLGESLELVVNLGGTRASDDGRRFTQGFVAGSLRAAVSPRVSAFAESYAFNREEVDGPSHRYVATGAVFFVDRETALDARVGRGIRNGDGTDWLVSVGISRRF